jgi:hypothetical protein
MEVSTSSSRRSEFSWHEIKRSSMVSHGVSTKSVGTLKRGRICATDCTWSTILDVLCPFHCVPRRPPTGGSGIGRTFERPRGSFGVAR